MATWQFSVVFIPSSWAEENSYSTSLLYDDDGYDTECAWKEKQPDTSFQDVLSEILPASESWHDDLLTWGDTEEHDIQVWCEEKDIEGIHIRMDLNQDLNEIVINVIKAAKVLDCALFFPEFKEIVKANEFELINALKKSNAAKFVNNPQEYLYKIIEETEQSASRDN